MNITIVNEYIKELITGGSRGGLTLYIYIHIALEFFISIKCLIYIYIYVCVCRVFVYKRKIVYMCVYPLPNLHELPFKTSFTSICSFWYMFAILWEAQVQEFNSESTFGIQQIRPIANHRTRVSSHISLSPVPVSESLLRHSQL